MANLSTLVPSVDMLLSMSAIELAPQLLILARQNLQGGLCHISGITGGWHGPQSGGQMGLSYPDNQREVIELAIGEAWQWLEVNGLIMDDPGGNGGNGHRRITRKGHEVLENPQQLASYLAAADFPRNLLHESFRLGVWLDLARGDYATAVFKAFRSVEETVRRLGGFPDDETGMPLMNKAFKPGDGLLSDATRPAGEQLALQHLFAGGIGSYKNPHSHKTITLKDPREAQQQVVIASHLMTILDTVAQRLSETELTAN